MKNYLATHIFKSEEMKKKFMDFVTSTPHEDLKKGVTGAKARCLVTMVGAGDSMKVFCRWEAESKDAIIEQLGDMNRCLPLIQKSVETSWTSETKEQRI